MKQSKFDRAAETHDRELAERLEWLQALLNVGAYRVEPEKIAEAMLAEHRPRRS